MMAFQDLVAAAQKYFPSLQVKYKNQSTFMKFLGTILFFNKGFMTDYVTTIGSTIYIPDETYMKLHSVSGSVVFMHELVHIYDSGRISHPLFTFLYLLPQIMAIFLLPLLFFVKWWIVLPMILLCLAPIPAYFRMVFEKRAYISSIYTLNALGKRLNFNPQLTNQTSFFVAQFKDSYYYFMWPFDVAPEFTNAITLVQSGQRPYQDPIFDILDDLVTKV
jgi:hypothetical protein